MQACDIQLGSRPSWAGARKPRSRSWTEEHDRTDCAEVADYYEIFCGLSRRKRDVFALTKTAGEWRRVFLPEAVSEITRAEINRLYKEFSSLVETSESCRREDSLKAEFVSLANQWRIDTRMLSFVRQKAVHPAYQQIIGMGKEALPFIFEELTARGGDWLWALQSITRENPASGKTSFRESVEAWLEWARQRGFVI